MSYLGFHKGGAKFLLTTIAYTGANHVSYFLYGEKEIAWQRRSWSYGLCSPTYATDYNLETGGFFEIIFVVDITTISQVLYSGVHHISQNFVLIFVQIIRIVFAPSIRPTRVSSENHPCLLWNQHDCSFIFDKRDSTLHSIHVIWLCHGWHRLCKHVYSNIGCWLIVLFVWKYQVRINSNKSAAELFTRAIRQLSVFVSLFVSLHIFKF